MYPKQVPTLLEKMSANNVPADISSLQPDITETYALDLSSEAAFRVLEFATAAIYLFQDENFKHLLSDGKSADFARLNQAADAALQEIAYQLMVLKRMIKILGGTDQFVQMADDGTYTLPVPNVQFIPISDVIQHEINDSPGYDPAISNPERPGIIIHSWGFNWTIDLDWDGTSETALVNPNAPSDPDYNPNWPYIFLAPYSNTENRLTDHWEVQWLVKPAKGKDGVDGAPGRDGVDGAPGRDGVDGAPGRDGVDGAPGRDGVDGAPGRDGVDGVCPDCTGGTTIIDPGPPPPPPTGGGDDGSGPGGGIWTNPTGQTGKDTSVCGEPVQIYAKDLIGLRSWIFSGAQLLYTDFDYPNVNLRPGIDAVASNTFPDYDPTRLKSATLLLDMAYLISETVPTPVPTGGFTNLTYTPENTLPRLYSDTARANLLGQFAAGTDNDLTVVAMINSTSKNIGIHAGVNDFTALTIDLTGNKQVYIDGSVVPLPLVASLVDTVLNGRTGARIFVSCLVYGGLCTTSGAVAGANSVPYSFAASSCADPQLAYIDYHADLGCFVSAGITRFRCSQATGNHSTRVSHIFGFKPGKTYQFRQQTNGSNPQQSWVQIIRESDGVLLAQSNTVTTPGTSTVDFPWIDYGQITIPEDFGDFCSLCFVDFDRTKTGGFGTQNDFSGPIEITEV